MARLLKADGTEVSVTPRAKHWTLPELQALVGGSIQLMPGVTTPKVQIIVNEEGRLRGLPLNVAATAVLHAAMAETLRIPVDQLPSEVGRRLHYLPRLVGDVVILEPGEKLR